MQQIVISAFAIKITIEWETQQAEVLVFIAHLLGYFALLRRVPLESLQFSARFIANG